MYQLPSLTQAIMPKPARQKLYQAGWAKMNANYV